MAPNCPECGSNDTQKLNPPTPKKTKDYFCNSCSNSWNRTGRNPRKYSF